MRLGFHRVTPLVIIVVGVLMFGCGGSIARGRRLYGEGRYIESAELLRNCEQDLAREPPKRQAEYAVYRGLSSLVLGNYDDAHRWMAFAYDIERSFPGTIRPEFRVDLDRGWRELGARMQAGPPAPAQMPAGALPPPATGP